MSASNYVFDATPENFTDLVLGNSVRGPVMVNFWSAKAGPCLKLWPVLEKLVEEYAGRYLLINFNVDKYQEFARSELAITSVPTVKIFSNLQVVDAVYGAESENSFRVMINRHMPRPSDVVLKQIVDDYDQENSDSALAALKQLQQTDPDNPRIALVIIKLMFREGKYEALQKYVKALSLETRKNEEVIHLLTMSHFLIAARQAPDKVELERALSLAEDDLELNYQLSALHLVNDDYVPAMELLLKIIRLERNFRDDIALKGMVSILNIIGSQETIAREYRQKMMDAVSV
ncbi:MAG: tetratricopeptide repeat protein [Gammaproteobacteria bacterium]|nr:tetratricopeptide repeat protein [Gammaproteobacteria bacterium]